MAKLFCEIKMGIFKQKVHITGEKYSNKKTTETFNIPTVDLANFIAQQNTVTEAYLTGPEAYIERIEEKTREQELKKYSKKKTTFL